MWYLWYIITCARWYHLIWHNFSRDSMYLPFDASLCRVSFKQTLLHVQLVFTLTWILWKIWTEHAFLPIRYPNQSFRKLRFEVERQQNMLLSISCASTSSAFCFSEFSEFQNVLVKSRVVTLTHTYWRTFSLRYCLSNGCKFENHTKSLETFLLVVFVVREGSSWHWELSRKIDMYL